MKLNHYIAYLRVAVDEYDEGRIAGYVYSRRLKEPIHFQYGADLLLQIEDLMDEQDFPRAFQKKRTFHKSVRKNAGHSEEDEDDGENMDEETVNQVQGKIATFALNIITRQNTSWQGYIDLLDGAPRRAFNSDLELLSIIMEKLNV